MEGEIPNYEKAYLSLCPKATPQCNDLHCKDPKEILKVYKAQAAPSIFDLSVLVLKFSQSVFQGATAPNCGKFVERGILDLLSELLRTSVKQLTEEEQLPQEDIEAVELALTLAISICDRLPTLSPDELKDSKVSPPISYIFSVAVGEELERFRKETERARSLEILGQHGKGYSRQMERDD